MEFVEAVKKEAGGGKTGGKRLRANLGDEELTKTLGGPLLHD